MPCLERRERLLGWPSALRTWARRVSGSDALKLFVFRATRPRRALCVLAAPASWAHSQWCTSAAVPSACFERDQTGKLPPSIFDCTNGTIAMA